MSGDALQVVTASSPMLAWGAFLIMAILYGCALRRERHLRRDLAIAKSNMREAAIAATHAAHVHQAAKEGEFIE